MRLWFFSFFTVIDPNNNILSILVKMGNNSVETLHYTHLTFDHIKKSTNQYALETFVFTAKTSKLHLICLIMDTDGGPVNLIYYTFVSRFTYGQKGAGVHC